MCSCVMQADSPNTRNFARLRSLSPIMAGIIDTDTKTFNCRQNKWRIILCQEWLKSPEHTAMISLNFYQGSFHYNDIPQLFDHSELDCQCSFHYNKACRLFCSDTAISNHPRWNRPRVWSTETTNTENCGKMKWNVCLKIRKCSRQMWAAWWF